jgi:tetratricopeptide (TPR) repeat protein
MNALLRRLGLHALTAGLVCLTGCAQVVVVPRPPQPLFHDSWFEPLAPVPTAQDLFRMSPEMLAYAAREFHRVRSGRDTMLDPRRELLHALYSTQRMQLQYDARITRNAEEAFAARTGNCLSLVIMTAAFAKELDLPLAYQSVDTPEFYSRNAGLTLASGHVNLVLAAAAPRGPAAKTITKGLDTLTVDFLPQDETRGQRTTTLAEATIVAMYLNNRAVELLALGHLNAAYAHARAALLQDPAFATAANTLGVIYSHTQRPDAAEAAFAHVLASEPDHLSALSNQAKLLTQLGRASEAEPLAQRLARLQPVAPFQQFNEGRDAMSRHDYDRARELFVRELRLQPYQDEVHFWAAQAYWQLGDRDRAERHLARAAEYSGSRSDHARYTAKLAHLRDQGAATP